MRKKNLSICLTAIAASTCLNADDLCFENNDVHVKSATQIMNVLSALELQDIPETSKLIHHYINEKDSESMDGLDVWVKWTKSF